MYLSPREELIKSVLDLQPEKIIAALDLGANPYVKHPHPDGSPGPSALELSLIPNGLTSMFDGEINSVQSVIGQKFENAFEAMLNVEPTDLAQRQEILNARLAAQAADSYSFEIYDLILKQANGRGISLIQSALNWFENDRYKHQTVLVIMENSASWQDVLASMSTEDIQDHMQQADAAQDYGKSLGEENVKFMDIQLSGEIMVKPNKNQDPNLPPRSPFTAPMFDFSRTPRPS